MAVIEQRGSSVRVNWFLGGGRNGARQSCTFQGTPTARMKLAKAAKELVESRGHAMSREECYAAILGKPDASTTAPTFKQWVDLWLADRARMRDIQPDVILSYRRILKSRAVPFLGHLRLTEIDHEILRNWVAWMSASRITIGSKNRRTGDRLLSANTIRRTHSITHACLGAAVPKYLTVNPAALQPGSRKHAGLPKVIKFEGMFLTRQEVNLLLDHCDPHIRDMVKVAVYSGLRLGELIALEVRHVLFPARGATILVRKSLKNDGTVGEPKSETSRRDVPVGEEVAQILRDRTRGKRPGSLVFVSPRGRMWDPHNFRDRYFYPSVAAAMRCPDHPPPLPPKPARGPRRSLRVDEVSECQCPSRLHRRPRFHDLRHTHASMLIAQGLHAKKIQMRLGHASYQTTMSVYGHLMDLGDSDEMERLEAMLRPDVPSLHVPTVESRTAIRRHRRVGAAAARARRAVRLLPSPRGAVGRVGAAYPQTGRTSSL